MQLNIVPNREAIAEQSMLITQNSSNTQLHCSPLCFISNLPMAIKGRCQWCRVLIGSEAWFSELCRLSTVKRELHAEWL